MNSGAEAGHPQVAVQLPQREGGSSGQARACVPGTLPAPARSTRRTGRPSTGSSSTREPVGRRPGGHPARGGRRITPSRMIFAVARSGAVAHRCPRTGLAGAAIQRTSGIGLLDRRSHTVVSMHHPSNLVTDQHGLAYMKITVVCGLAGEGRIALSPGRRVSWIRDREGPRAASSRLALFDVSTTTWRPASSSPAPRNGGSWSKRRSTRACAVPRHRRRPRAKFDPLRERETSAHDRPGHGRLPFSPTRTPPKTPTPTSTICASRIRSSGSRITVSSSGHGLPGGGGGVLRPRDVLGGQRHRRLVPAAAVHA